MTIPQEHVDFFDQIIAAGGAGNLAIVEAFDKATGEERTVLAIYEPTPDVEGGYSLLAFAALDFEIMQKVTPPETVREVRGE